MPEVESEGTGWSGEALSRQYRRWGLACSIGDLDFACYENDKGEVAAIVGYKNEHDTSQCASDPACLALGNLGTRAGVPVFICRYTDDFSLFTAIPLNKEAEKHLFSSLGMTETEWVTFLYTLRGYDCPQSVIDRIGTVL